MSTPTAGVLHRTKTSFFHVGFIDGKQVTGWDRRKDKVHSNLRTQLRQRSGKIERSFVEKVKTLWRKVRDGLLTKHDAEADTRKLADEKKGLLPKAEIRTQGFVEKR